MTTELKVLSNPRDPEEDLIAKLRLDPGQIDAAVQVPITLQCRKPYPNEFIRVHPELELNVAAIHLKDDNDSGFYIVTPAMVPAIGGQVKAYVLRPYVTRTGVLRLWPISLPDPSGRVLEWHRSAAVAATLAMRKWVRVTSNMALRAYEVYEAVVQPLAPEWPELSLPDMLRIAFKDQDRIIDSPEHPVFKQLTG